MSTSLRVAALAVTISLSTGCGFFSLDDDDSDKGGSGSHPEMGGSGGGGGSITTMGGTGGNAQGGSSGSAMAGTSSGSGGAGAAGSGGSAGSDGGSSGAAAAGMAGSAGAAMGGMAGDMSSGGTGGVSGSGVSGMAGSGPTGCEALAPGAQSHAGHCYLLVTNGANWGNAKKSCSDKGGHLVTISSAEPLMQSDFDDESDFVFKELGGSKDTWIGLSDGHTDKESATDGEFKWVNDEALTLENWNDNEPNHYMKDCMDGSDCWEHCVFMMTDPAGKWNDELCEMSKQYVCEWDMGG